MSDPIESDVTFPLTWLANIKVKLLYYSLFCLALSVDDSALFPAQFPEI